MNQVAQMMAQMGYPRPFVPPAAPAPASGFPNPQPSFPAPAPQTTAPPVDPKVLYAVQLVKLKEMGFTNEEVNLDALKATHGIIDAAIERILTMLK
jgi:hypothetical protein